MHNVFIWFLDQATIGLDPKSWSFIEVICDILQIADFEAAILKNGRN